MSKKTALIVVDIQNDFCEGGSLSVPQASDIIKPVNKLIESYENVILTQDWHPKNHISFLDGSWPEHCIEGTYGANFHKDLIINKAQLILRKGYHQNIDSYSAFLENDKKTPTGLAAYLKQREINSVVICGLALDFCVGYSVLDAINYEFNTSVVLGACRSIDTDGSVEQMLTQMKQAGAIMLLGS